MEGYNPPIITEEDDGTGASPVSGVVVAGVVILVVLAVAVYNQGLTISNYSTHTTYLT